MKIKVFSWPFTEKSVQRLHEAFPDLPPHKNYVASLFEVEIYRKTFFCCQSGGAMPPEYKKTIVKVIPGSLMSDLGPKLTVVGEASMDALFNWLDHHSIEPNRVVIRELKKGSRSTEKKMRDIFRAIPDRSAIIFIGDFAGEMDGEMSAILLKYGERA